MAHERLFDYPFDFQKYIEQRLREFDDIEERTFAKTILMDGLLNIIKETEAKYDALDKRIYSEIQNDTDKYAIRMTIIKKTDYDPTNPTWFPVITEDIKGYKVAPEEAAEALAKTEGIRVGTVYIEGEDEICALLNQAETPFMGKLLTAKGEIQAEFRLKRSVLHQGRIEALYALFNENSVPWTTVLAAYLDKCYEIRLIKTQTPLSADSEIKGYAVDYGAYAPLIREDVMPLWNLENIHYNCAQFPTPCLDTINYEHEFPTKAFGEKNGFLIEKNEEIVGFRYEKEKIYVATPKATFSKWSAWRIITEDPIPSLGYTYPVLNNAKRESFSKIYLRRTRTELKTSADLYRKVHELGLESFVRFLGCQIFSGDANGFKEADVNWFIKDELFDKGISRILLLKFEPVNKENYLNGAIVRYIVSEIQQSQSEYRCMGVLIESEEEER